MFPDFIGLDAGLQIIVNEGDVIGRGLKIPSDEVAVKQRAISLADPFQVIRIRPVPRPGHQAVFDRVGVDITAQVQQMGLRFDRYTGRRDSIASGDGAKWGEPEREVVTR